MPPLCARVLRAACLAGVLLELLGAARAGDGGDPGDAATLSQPAAASATDKSQYNLFNPTPTNLLRDFSTSRPDQTTSPATVDAGHFYLELGLFANTLADGAARTSTWTALQNSHFRVGLTNTIELELIYDGVSNQNIQALPATGGKRTDQTVGAGSGNMIVNLRFNFIGDDGGPIVFGIIPQLVAPTATSRLEPEHFAGSVILPASFNLPAAFSAVLQVQPGSGRNADNTRHAFALTTGATLYHNLFRPQDHLQAYVEYFDTLVTGQDGAFPKQVDVGVLWQPIQNWQLDLGSNFGVSRDAPAYQSFAGISTRF